jgi:hypothetical protein
MSWCWAPIWSPWPDFCFLFDNCGLVCNLLVQLLMGLARGVTFGSKSRRTHDDILLSHLRLPQPGGPGPRIYIPQEQGGPVISPGTGFPFRRLLRLSGLRWRYSNPPPHRGRLTVKIKVTLRLTDSQSICLDVEPLLVLMARCLLLFHYYCCVFVGLPLWRKVGSVDCQSESAFLNHLSVHI